MAKNTSRPIIANTVSSLLLSLFLVFDPEFLMNSLLTLKGKKYNELLTLQIFSVPLALDTT